MNVFFNFLNANTLLLQILWKLLLASLIVIALALMAKKLRWLKIYGIMFLAAMCGLFYASRLPQAPCPDSATFAETQHLSGAQIVQQIFEQQLVWQQSKRPLAAGKITAYKIEKVISVPKTENVYSVVYSIQSYDDSYKAGNGHIADNNWIYNKSLYVSLLKQADGYKLETVGTRL